MIVAAQILHQHKDKVIYEKPIIKDTPALSVTRKKLFFCFETVLFQKEPAFINRWRNGANSKITTERILRFAHDDGTFYQLQKRPLEARLYIYELDYFVYLRVKFEVTHEEASELGKLFGLPYNINL